ncbi:MAG TPA: PCRF domain-containing protein, partial [Patescibacteria group bacterium]|nr:PCRF domain-containing protein [Patescibacteria group bacterium]
MNELKSKLEQLYAEITDIISHLNLPQKEQLLLEMEEKANDPNFWSDPQAAGQHTKKAASIRSFVEFWRNLEKNCVGLLELAEHTEVSSPDVDEISKEYEILLREFEKNKILAVLSGKYDSYNAIVALHAGAGGVDAMDWTEMLLRMITRYSEKKGFEVEVLDISKNPEAGVKSVTLEIKGQFAFGLLK